MVFQEEISSLKAIILTVVIKNTTYLIKSINHCECGAFVHFIVRDQQTDSTKDYFVEMN